MGGHGENDQPHRKSLQLSLFVFPTKNEGMLETQLPHFGGFDGGKAADFRDPSRLRSNCGAKNCCASEGLSALTGSAAVCWHSGPTRAFRSPGC